MRWNVWDKFFISYFIDICSKPCYNTFINNICYFLQQWEKLLGGKIHAQILFQKMQAPVASPEQIEALFVTVQNPDQRMTQVLAQAVSAWEKGLPQKASRLGAARGGTLDPPPGPRG